jgi:predicted nucleic-acid-binding protein
LKSDDIFIPKTVLLETEWVLRHAYKIGRLNIIIGFQKLLGLPNVNIEDPDCIYQAISWYENKFDFVDALHLASSRRCISFATFDSSFIKKAQQFSSMDMIKT